MLLTIIFGICTLVLAYFVWRFSMEATQLRARYGHIVDVGAAVAAAKQDLARIQQGYDARRATVEQGLAQREQEHRSSLEAQRGAAQEQLDRIARDRQQFESEDQQRRAKLNQEYEQALTKYTEMRRELSLVEEGLEDISFGLYKPHFSFQTPEDYKTALAQMRERERAVIHNGQAVVCPVKWSVGNSEKEGARMVKQNIKLILRAFNGECEAARADVSWNNVAKMEERIKKSCEAINKLSGVLQVTVTADYLKLKLNELRLTHELEDRKYQDREEQRRIREQIREEERAQREMDKAREEAQTEEERYQKALVKAREEAALATGAALQKLTAQVNTFETKLDEARKRKERAIARAQLTKSGFVYVISNIGSFGEKVYKIGMTRRLEPMERIIELGDASVPFPFDLHAMLYSDNAPELENALHQLFEDRRINRVNSRREFYRDIELEEIQKFVTGRGLSAQFIKDAEAREYRESLAKQTEQRPAAQPTEVSESLFETTSIGV